MSDEELPQPEPGPQREGHPVLWGLLAFVAVVAVVAGVAGGGAVVAGRALGLTETTDASQGTRVEETLELPPVSATPDANPTPSITLLDDPTPEPTSEYTEIEEREPEITLVAGSSTVTPMQTLDLTGTYVGGDGAVLQVERLVEEVWTEFPVTVFVNGGSFSTFIQTGVPGPSQFRVRDVETDDVSNEVTVTVG